MNRTSEATVVDFRLCKNPACARNGCMLLREQPTDHNATDLIRQSFDDGCRVRPDLYGAIHAALTFDSPYLPPLSEHNADPVISPRLPLG